MRTILMRFPVVLFAIMTAFGCCTTGSIGGVASAQTVQAHSSMGQLERDFRSATALLYGQTDRGSYIMLCTATAYEKKGDVYHFVTAAHCVAEDDTEHKRVEVAPSRWFLSFEDDPDNTMFVGAKLLHAGYQHRGDDFAVLEAKISHPVPVIPLAKDDPSLAEEFSNFASPGGLGKQLFRGHVSMEKLDRPLIQGEINWKGAVLLQAQAAGGSSGSAIVSMRQNGIIAFLVGMIGGNGTPNVVAIQVSKFKKFNEMNADGKYKWYKPDSDASSIDSDADTKSLERIWQRIYGNDPAATTPFYKATQDAEPKRFSN